MRHSFVDVEVQRDLVVQVRVRREGSVPVSQVYSESSSAHLANTHDIFAGVLTDLELSDHIEAVAVLAEGRPAEIFITAGVPKKVLDLFIGPIVCQRVPV